MGIQELKQAIAQLSRDDLARFSWWFEEFKASLWDREFETDVMSGKLDTLGKQADADFEAGRCKPL